MPFARTKDYVRFGRDAAIQKLIRGRDLAGSRVSAQQRQDMLARLSAKYTGQQAFVFQATSQTIDSTYINNIMEAIFVDLDTIYRSFTEMAGARQYRINILDSRATRLKASVRQLKQDIKRLQALYDHPGYDDAIFLDFADTSNYSQSLDRAEVDNESHRLKLMKVTSKDHTKQAYRQNAEITVNYLTNGTISNAGSFGPDKMLDPDKETFWAATIMTDTPIIDFPVTLEKKSLEGQLVDQPGYKANGAIVEIVLSFRKARWINNLKITPFGNYPIRVIQASYTPEEGGTYRQIPVFEVDLATQNIDQIDLSFEGIPVFSLKLLIEQENYTKAQYQVPLEMVRDNLLWQQMIDPDVEGTPLDTILNDLKSMLDGITYEYGSTDTSEGIGKILSAIPALINRYTASNHNLADLYAKFRSDGDIVSVDKYEYLLGIRDLQANFNEYALDGEWRGPRMTDNKGILQIELETTEQHSVVWTGDDYRPASSIAYSVDLGRQTLLPILPGNSVDNNGDLLVKSEVLVFDVRTMLANTRFPLDTEKPYSVYADNVKVRGFTVRELLTTAEIGIPQSLFNPNQIYTITYYPIGDVDKIKFRNLTSRQVEAPLVYTATGANNAIVLPSFPYIEYEVVNGVEFFNRPDPYDGVWVYSAKRGTAIASDQNGRMLAATLAQIQAGRYSRRLLDGVHYGSIPTATVLTYEPIKVTIDGAKAYNVTDYLTGENPIMPETTQTNRKYQFIHLRNKILLNAAVTDSQISIVYNTKADHVQLVAELSSNNGGALGFTPIMEDGVLLLRARRI